MLLMMPDTLVAAAAAATAPAVSGAATGSACCATACKDGSSADHTWSNHRCGICLWLVELVATHLHSTI